MDMVGMVCCIPLQVSFTISTYFCSSIPLFQGAAEGHCNTCRGCCES